MSKRIDGFCNDLRDGLNAVEARLATFKNDLQSLPKKGEQALHASLEEVRKQITFGKEQVTKMQQSMTMRAEHKIAETKEAIDDWKSKKEIGKLDKRAERSESHAESAVEDALAMVRSAEEAILEAAIARSDADEAKLPAVAANC